MVGCCHLIMLVMINYCILFGLTDGTDLFFLNVFLFICFWLFLSFSGARSSVGQGLHLNWEFWTSLQGSQWPLVQKLNSRKKKMQWISIWRASLFIYSSPLLDIWYGNNRQKTAFHWLKVLNYECGRKKV